MDGRQDKINQVEVVENVKAIKLLKRYNCIINYYQGQHVEQSSFIQIVDMNRFFTGTCERLVNRLSEKVVKSRILPKIQVCSENKNKHKI